MTTKNKRKRKVTCPRCGNEMDYRAKTCKLCYQKGRKKKEPILAWRKILLGDTSPPGPNDPIGLCEICDKRERTTDTWWCQGCIEAIDADYLERSLTSKLRRGEKRELMVAA